MRKTLFGSEVGKEMLPGGRRLTAGEGDVPRGRAGRRLMATLLSEGSFYTVFRAKERERGRWAVSGILTTMYLEATQEHPLTNR